MSQAPVALLHYSAPPVVGGVEAVMDAHARQFLAHRYPVTFIAGEGEEPALPRGSSLVLIPEMSTQAPDILAIQEELGEGRVPRSFEPMVDRLAAALEPSARQASVLFVHNVFTKHFNLALTAALFRLLDRGALPPTVAWCHDFSWSSAHSQPCLHAGYPWDLLRVPRADLTYVTISAARQAELAGLLDITPERIRVIPNGVDPVALLGLTPEGASLAREFGLLESDLILLMPVRVTQAKNIELALRVTAELKKRGLRAPRVVLTGPPDPHSADALAYYQELLDLRRELGVEREFCFVYGADGPGGHTLTLPEVGELYRLADAVFMPSHREGAGMPVLEAGLAGLPVIASDRVPAAMEQGGEDVLVVSPDARPADLARRLLAWLDSNSTARFKRRARQEYTWPAIFEGEIEPLVNREVVKLK